MCFFRKKEEVLPDGERYDTDVAVDLDVLNPFILNRCEGPNVNYNTEFGYFNSEGKAKSWFMRCDNEAYEALQKQYMSWLDKKNEQL
jgi:hypothetical protein